MNTPIPSAPQPQGTPLTVQSAPVGQPSLTPPPSSAPSPAATPTTATAAHPLYQGSLNMLTQVAQLGQPGQTGQPDPQAGESGATGVALGATKGALSTLNSLSDLGQNVLSQTAGRVANLVTGKGFTPTQKSVIPKENLKANGTAEKIGAGAEQLLEFIALPELGAEGAAAKGATTAATAATDLGLAADTASTIGKATSLGIKAAAEGTKSLALGQLHDSTNPGLDFAAGAAAPVIGAGLSKAWDALPSLIQKGTGLTDTIVQQATKDPVAFKAAVKSVAENPQAPYVGLAHDVFNGMLAGKQAAKDAYQQGIDKVIQLTEGKTYNVSPQIQEISKVLKDDYGLPVKLARAEDGTVTKALKLVTDTPNGNPFSATETKNIEGLMNDMRAANGKSFKGLVNLQKNVDSYFDTDVFGNAKSTPYNSVITKLSNIVDNKVSAAAGEAMPTMDAINQQYRTYKQIFNQFGKTFVDSTTGTPQVSTRAESFLSNLLGKNKAALQGNVAKQLEEFTGVPILDRAVQTKAAVDMSKLVSDGKANVVQKFLAKGGKWIGGAAGGLVTKSIGGAIGGAAAGEAVGKTIGAFTNPETGLKAIQATQRLEQVGSQVAEKIPVLKTLGKRFSP